MTCRRLHAAWIRAELRAHATLKRHGKTTRYRRAEHASELAFNRAWAARCAWAKR